MRALGPVIALALWVSALASAAPEKAPTPAASPVVLYENGFEAENALAGWLAINGTWATAPDETTALRHTQSAFRGVARILHLPANYEVSTTVRPGTFSGQWGVGLVAYWQPQEGCYRLSNFGGALVLWRETGESVDALAAVRMELKAQPYRMRFSVQNENQATTLRGKVWAQGEREPEQWTILAQDLDKPLRFGRAGLFTGRASAAFSDFAITPLGAAPADANAPAAPVGERYWEFVGGEWQALPGGARQSVAGSTVGFRAAAYALAAGWANTTLQVSAKADSGSRNQGFGMSAYWLSDDQQYQFGQMNGNTLILARRAPGADFRQLASVPFALRKGLWYSLKLQLSNEKAGVRLRGKVWPARAGEPTQWQIETLDEARPRLNGGEIGLWCIDDVCSFDDVQVTAP